MEHARQLPPGHRGVGGALVGFLHLAQDLRLAHHGGLQARGDAQEMAQRFLAVQLEER